MYLFCGLITASCSLEAPKLFCIVTSSNLLVESSDQQPIQQVNLNLDVLRTEPRISLVINERREGKQVESELFTVYIRHTVKYTSVWIMTRVWLIFAFLHHNGSEIKQSRYDRYELSF